MSNANNMTDSTPLSVHRPRPDPEPDPEPNPEPDSAIRDQQFNIAPDDWDVLFHAITERLEACTDSAPLGELPEIVSEHVMVTTPFLKATLRDCVQSMNLLHAALPLDWQQRKPR